MIVNKTIDYKARRRKAYMPLEDQIDAIVKCLKHLQSNGIDIGSDIQPIIQHRDEVKSKFPNKDNQP